MYIVKISENKKEGYYNGVPNMLDGYHEVESLEEAKEMRKHWIESYPLLVKVEIFKSEEVKIIDNFQEECRKNKEEYWTKIEHYKSLGFNGYKEMNEKGEVTFEF